MAAALRKNLILAFHDQNNSFKTSFKALDMICIQKYTSLGLHNLEIRCEEAKSIKYLQ